MGQADAKVAEILEVTQVGLDCLTTELVAGVPPFTPEVYERGISCYVTDATTTPPSINSIFRWTGTQWSKY